jgi:hypothetical protein
MGMGRILAISSWKRKSDRQWLHGRDDLGVGLPDGRVLVSGAFGLDPDRSTQKVGKCGKGDATIG